MLVKPGISVLFTVQRRSLLFIRHFYNFMVYFIVCKYSTVAITFYASLDPGIDCWCGQLQMVAVLQVIPYRARGDEEDSSDNEALTLQIRADLDDLRPQFQHKKRRHEPLRLNTLQRAARSDRSIVRANRRLRRPPPPCPRPPLVKTASRQSLHSRRHLANMLAFQVTLSSKPGVFNPRPAGRLRPSGEFCAAREGYFTKYNAL